MAVTLEIAAHPVLELRAFVSEFERDLADTPASPIIAELLCGAGAPSFASDERVRAAIRDLLRHGGYKPTGRGKPSSEYLLRAVGEGALAPINAAVDACNAVSYHSGLPISVVDFDRAEPPLRVAIAAPGTAYVFNASGQEISVDGLLCLHDRSGACANAVKDAHRTKTHSATRRTLSIIWSSNELPGRAAATASWYCELLAGGGARTEAVEIAGAT